MAESGDVSRGTDWRRSQRDPAMRRSSGAGGVDRGREMPPLRARVSRVASDARGWKDDGLGPCPRPGGGRGRDLLLLPTAVALCS
jgi:hypothetical protein